MSTNDDSSDEEWNQIIEKIKSTCKKNTAKKSLRNQDVSEKLLTTFHSLHLDSTTEVSQDDDESFKVRKKNRNRIVIESDDGEDNISTKNGIIGDQEATANDDEQTELLTDVSCETESDNDSDHGQLSPDLDTDKELYDVSKCSRNSACFDTSTSSVHEVTNQSNSSTSSLRSPLRDVTEEYTSSSYSTINSSDTSRRFFKNEDSIDEESDQENIEPKEESIKDKPKNYHFVSSSDEEWDVLLSPRKPIKNQPSTSKLEDPKPKRKNLEPQKTVSGTKTVKNFGIHFDLEKPIPSNYYGATRNKWLTSLFSNFDKLFFDSTLTTSNVDILWSNQLTKCAGKFHGRRRPKFEAYITLSSKLLIKRNSIDFVQTMLHEMIHAYLFVKEMRDKSSHGPNFKSLMNRINSMTGMKITVFHSFHDEVNSCKVYIWRCNGVCKSLRAFSYGYIKRAANRCPSEKDLFWKNHATYCSGSFDRIFPGTESYEFAMNCVR